MQNSDLDSAYRERYGIALVPVAEALEQHLKDLFKGQPRIDRISARAKDPVSFLKKAAAKDGSRAKYSEPLAQIQDQIGARVITYYQADVQRIAAIVKAHFRFIELREHVPDSEWEFGYFGLHFILVLPNDVVDDEITRSHIPDFFELQIKTLFQHAWSEAEHDLGYKTGSIELTSEQKRKLAFTSAQAWGADQIFDDLFFDMNGLA